MKLFLSFLLFNLSIVYGQKNTLPISPEIPNKEYATYHYDKELKIDILIYSYSIWKIDNDNLLDIIEFKSNGGAHAFYNLRIWLSSTNSWFEYPNFYVDHPYLSTEKTQKQELLVNKYYPQFLAQNFDNDKRDEIYLNLNHSFAPSKETLKKHKLDSKKILIDYKNGKLHVIDFR